MNAMDEIRLAKIALDLGLLTHFQLETAMIEYARQKVRNLPDAQSLRDILVGAGAMSDTQWINLQETRQKPEEAFSSSKGSFGKYMIERELGRGGMGVVYEATDSKLNRKVALKLLNAPMNRSDQEESERRFLQESRLLAILPKHVSVVSVYEAGVIGGQRYIAMELVDGICMSIWQTNASLQDQMSVLRQVALAVHHAHIHGIIHRDLKPENVLIRRDATPVIMDFGLATPERRDLRLSLTAQGFVIGSPGYMSPERARGLKCLDRTTDVYSLGVMLFQMLTGRMPFEGKTPMEILTKAVENAPPRASTLMKRGLNPVLLDKLESICSKALATKTKDRYPTTKAFAEDLSMCLRPALKPALTS